MPRRRWASGGMFWTPIPESAEVPYTQRNMPSVTMMTTLLRTGVHIIAPNLPRALRIWPITTWMPMKKIEGRK